MEEIELAVEEVELTAEQVELVVEIFELVVEEWARIACGGSDGNGCEISGRVGKGCRIICGGGWSSRQWL